MNQHASRPASFSRLVIAGWLAALAACLALAPLGRAGNPRRTQVVEVVEKVQAAVVNIHSERSVQGPASVDMYALAPSSGSRINGMGTGVIIDPRGYIITNQHVVEDVSVIRVRLADGSTHAASVLARDHESDLALLKVDAGRPLPTIPLGTAQDIMVGETVIAIGNAYGYEHSVTVGIVSAVKRDVTLNKEVSYKSLIQTDASINPGNSGGPLLNVNGEMIGVNVAIRAGAQGISFAIPVDTMLKVSADMLAAQQHNAVWHGLVCQDRLVPDVSDIKLQSRKEGDAKSEPEGLRRELLVERVEPNSPAAKSGLQAGDVIVQVQSAPVGSRLDLERVLLERASGDKLPVVVRRAKAEQKAELVLQAAERRGPTPAEVVWKRLGLRLRPVNAELVSRTSQQLHGGMMVVDVSPSGPGDRAGMQRGDILVGLHQWETLTLDNVTYVLNQPDLASFTPMNFYIIRAGQVRHGWFSQID